MPAPSFDKLARDLEAVGAAHGVIARTIQELSDHCADAEASALARGLSPLQARREAEACLGPLETIVWAVAARPELLDWRHRWPHSARCVDSITGSLVWPVAPFVYFATHPAGLVRWGVSSGLGLIVTGSLLFCLQWLIG